MEDFFDLGKAKEQETGNDIEQQKVEDVIIKKRWKKLRRLRLLLVDFVFPRLIVIVGKR